jgi:hypothetical protein
MAHQQPSLAQQMAALQRKVDKADSWREKRREVRRATASLEQLGLIEHP